MSNGRTVDYEIRVKPPGAERPEAFDVKYQVTDPATGETVKTTVTFDNDPGQVFDRVPKKDM